jgi:hypothetical protein
MTKRKDRLTYGEALAEIEQLKLGRMRDKHVIDKLRDEVAGLRSTIDRLRKPVYDSDLTDWQMSILREVMAGQLSRWTASERLGVSRHELEKMIRRFHEVAA